MAEAERGTLAIVGASARAAALAALRAGWKVVAADLFADADLARHVSATRVAHYPTDFLPWLRERAVTAWMYTGALENYPRLVDQMARVAPLWGTAGQTLRDIRSPWRIAESLREAGLMYPHIARSVAGLPTDGSWLSKPLRGSNGAGIERWTGQPPSSSRRMYWQRLVDGAPCAALYVAAAGTATLLGVTQQLVGTAWTGAKPFQYAGSIGPWPTTPVQDAQIERIGHTLARAFGLVGLFGVDLLLENDTVWTIEVNPRYTAAAEVVERFTGVNPIAVHVDACRPAIFPDGWPTKQPDRYHGKAILYAEDSCWVSREFFDWAIEQSGPALDAALTDIPAAGTRVPVGHPVLTVLAEGKTPGMVEAGLRSKIIEVSALSRKRWGE